MMTFYCVLEVVVLFSFSVLFISLSQKHNTHSPSISASQTKILGSLGMKTITQPKCFFVLGVTLVTKFRRASGATVVVYC